MGASHRVYNEDSESSISDSSSESEDSDTSFDSDGKIKNSKNNKKK